MRVLLTGCTPRQAHYVDDLYYTYFRGLRSALEHQGHDVVWRAVTPGEDLQDRFDCAIVGLHGMASIASKRYKFGALWALSRLPHLALYQDWHVRTTMQQLKTTPNTFWKSAHLNDGDMRFHSAARLHVQTLEDARDALWRRGTATLLCMFEWADVGRFTAVQRCTSAVAWSPDPFNPYADAVELGIHGDRPRARRWSLSSLYNQDPWVDSISPEWPVLRVYRPADSRGAGGTRHSSADGTPQWKPRRELEVLAQDVETSWGVLLPFYGRECFPGWWRSRYYTTALAGAILLADPIEVQDMPIGAYDLDVSEIEAMQDDELAELATAQRTLLRLGIRSRESSALQLEKALADAAAPLVVVEPTLATQADS